MDTFTYYDGLSGRAIVRLPADAVADCSHAGRCDDDVAAWVERVEWLADDNTLRRHLREYGAWDDLETCEQRTLRERALWIAAGDCEEEPELYRDESAETPR